eukprot:TRINITY_DN28287_c0_g1_i1.p2 TRINITY_DN28287_c0_g1~~TRINITY_DN28287_c0_g1_i1.p2  ORF type:complete len:246 (+),score=87.11 TRINITY_DN28287_c0_g1_i1:77-814(+)
MARRAGSAAAEALFRSVDGAEWAAALDKYDACVRASAARGGAAAQLVADDAWFRTELPAALQGARTLTLPQLSRAVRWKLARGQWRPLQRLVDGNSPAAVDKAGRAAIELLLPPKGPPRVGEALKALSALSGVGPATASAIAAAVRPDAAPFMADEAMEAVPGFGARTYTPAAYARFSEALVARAAELRKMKGLEGYDAETVGRALWARAKAAEGLAAKDPGPPPTTGQRAAGAGAPAAKRKRMG